MAAALTTIVETGDESNEVYFLGQGTLEVMVGGHPKHEFNEIGRMFGETCFDPDSPTRTADIRAKTSVEYFVLKAITVEQAIESAAQRFIQGGGGVMGIMGGEAMGMQHMMGGNMMGGGAMVNAMKYVLNSIL